MTYDIAGRPKKYRNNTVEWNGSQMTKYGRNTYEYDGNNYRVFKQTPTEKTYYSYDGSGNLRFERRGRTEINYIYDAGGIRGMKVTVPTDDPSTYYASSEFYYVKDSLGNIRVILDKSGNIMVEYNYDAWGNFIAEKVREVCIGSVTVDLVSLNAFTYRGYYYDKESGLYYLINRYYDPTTGRFISPDDVGYLDFESFFGTNRYAYCLDNPVMYSDHEGTNAWTDFWNSSTGRLVGSLIVLAVMIALTIVTYGFFSGIAASTASTFVALAVETVRGALTGAILGGGLSMMEQIREKGFSGIDLRTVGYEVVKGGFSGAIGGAFSSVLGKVGSVVGEQMGWALSKVTHLSSGMKIGTVFSAQLLGGIGNFTGRVFGDLIGNIIGDEVWARVSGEESNIEDTLSDFPKQETYDLTMEYFGDMLKKFFKRRYVGIWK